MIFQGTRNSTIIPDEDGGIWEEYQFKCKPGDPKRRPCVISPYHYRLDWLMWFAAFQVSKKGLPVPGNRPYFVGCFCFTFNISTIMYRLLLIQLFLGIPTSPSKYTKIEIKILTNLSTLTPSPKQNSRGVIGTCDPFYFVSRFPCSGVPICSCHFCYSHCDGAVVRALASYKCGLGLDLIPGAISRLNLLLVFVLSLGSLVFLPSQTHASISNSIPIHKQLISSS